MRWNLDSLYPSFDSKEFQNDFKEVTKQINDIKTWAKENFDSHNNASEKAKQFLKKTEQITLTSTRLGMFSGLVMSTDVKNQEAQSYHDKLMKVSNEMTAPVIQYNRWIDEIDDLQKLIESDPYLKKLKFNILETKDEAKHMLSEKEEIIISKMQQNASAAWTKLYNTLSSSQLVEIEKNGKIVKLPLPIVRNMAFDKDKEVRRKAFEAELKSYKQVEDGLACALNSIKGEAIELCNLRKFESPIDMTLKSSRLDKESLDAMMEAMRESFPVFRKFLKQKAKVLGHSKGLPFYDIFAPLGELNLTFTFEETRDFIVEKFKNFSQEISDFAQMVFDKEWIDAEPREGKHGGGFCASIETLGETRILTNFTGTFSDIRTLAHEIGHAYHASCLTHENIHNTTYPMPVAETASIFCENIINDAFMSEVKEQDKITLLDKNISDSIQCIVDISSRFVFESEVFKRREESSLSVKQLKEIMINAQKETYGDGLDPEKLHPYMWACKPHYYYGELHFYNFPYAFGLLFSQGLYEIFKTRGSAFTEDYKKLLANTGKMSTEDVAKSMDINISDKNFWKKSLSKTMKDIETFCKITE